jgi:hypothetical protein
MAANYSTLKAAVAFFLFIGLLGCGHHVDSEGNADAGNGPTCEVMGGGVSAIFPNHDRPGFNQCAVKINELNVHYVMNAWLLLSNNQRGILNYGINSYEDEYTVIIAFGLLPEGLGRPRDLPIPSFRNAAVECAIHDERECVVTHLD